MVGSAAAYSASATVVAMAKGNGSGSGKGVRSGASAGANKVTRPPRITSNVKQSLRVLKFWKEYERRQTSGPQPATRYRKKKVMKEVLPDDTDIYEDPSSTLQLTNEGLEIASPVILVDGYNVCGYWGNLKKDFMNGRQEIARQMLIDDLVSFSAVREVKVVVVFDAANSGVATHKETYKGVDVVFSSDLSADSWIEKEVLVFPKSCMPSLDVTEPGGDEHSDGRYGDKGPDGCYKCRRKAAVGTETKVHMGRDCTTCHKCGREGHKTRYCTNCFENCLNML